MDNNQNMSTYKDKLLQWKVLFFALIICNVIALIYLFFGFGNITISAPNNSLVYLNENSKGNVTSLKVRPGTYSIRIANSQVSPEIYNIRVFPFGKVNIVASTIDSLKILETASGTPYVGGEFTVLEESKLSNDWLVVKYKETRNDNLTTIAYRYAFNKWNTVVYYPDDISNLSKEQQLNKLPTQVVKIFTEYTEVKDED